MDERRKTQLRRAAWGAAALLFGAFYIDDWSRDFTSYAASTSPASVDPGLRPFESTRPLEDMVDGVGQAARRIRNWESVGPPTQLPNGVELRFVRTQRLLRIKDDIVVRIEDRGERRVITAESRSRLGLGDLGRNPRNLRRLRAELADVLQGAARVPSR